MIEVVACLFQKFARRLQQREQQLAEMARIERELQQQQRVANIPQVVLADAGYKQGMMFMKTTTIILIIIIINSHSNFFSLSF